MQAQVKEKAWSGWWNNLPEAFVQFLCKSTDVSKRNVLKITKFAFVKSFDVEVIHFGSCEVFDIEMNENEF